MLLLLSLMRGHRHKLLHQPLVLVKVRVELGCVGWLSLWCGRLGLDVSARVKLALVTTRVGRVFVAAAW